MLSLLVNCEKVTLQVQGNVRVGYSFLFVCLEFLYCSHCNCLFNMLKTEKKLRGRKKKGCLQTLETRKTVDLNIRDAKRYSYVILMPTLN